MLILLILITSFLLSAVDCVTSCFSRCVCSDNKASVDCSSLGLNYSLVLPADIEKLDYSGNHFDFLNQTFFSHIPYLRILNLSNSHVFEIHEDAFNPLHELLILDLSSNFLSAFHLNLFKNMTNLQQLYLKKNFFASLPKGIFYSLQNLEFLDISHNFLKGFELWQNLVGLENLKTVYFYGNTLKKLESDTLSILWNTSLENFDLSNTNIEFIDEFAFSPLVHLRHLKLDGNAGVAAPVNQDSVLRWLPHTNVTSLSLRYVTSWEESVTWSIIRNMKSITLQTLDMSFNYLRVISEPIFQDSSKINHLILRHMQLEEIHLNAFEPLIHLEVLDLSFNNLKYLFQPVTNFTALQRLKKLDLSNNLFVSLTTVWDAHTPGLSIYGDQLILSQLEILIIENNKLLDFKQNLFNSMPKLKQLHASFAFLRELSASDNLVLDKDTFYHENLEYIDLSRNHLKFLASETFSDCFALKELNLADNRLGPAFSQDKLGHLFSNLSSLLSLDLSRNEIDFLPLEQFSSLSFLKVLNLNYNKITGFPPDVFDGLNSLESFHIKANKITVLDAGGLQLLKNLKEIDFSENPLQCQCDVIEFFHWVNFSNLTIIRWEHLDDYFCNLRNASLKEFLFTAAENECLHMESNIILICVIAISSIVIFLLLFCLALGLYRYIYVRANVEMTPKNIAISRQNKVKDYDAFISYSGKDAPWVPEVFQKHLGGERKLRLCFHDNHQHMGRTINWDMMNKIDSSFKVLFIITKNFVQAEWFQWESMMLLFQDCAILVGLEDIPTTNMAYTLQWLVRTKPFLNWPMLENDHGLFWDDLAIYIKEDSNRKSPLYI